MILRGFNMVCKVGSYRPEDTGFGRDDARFLRRHGFNSIRLGIIYAGLEPSPPAADGTPDYRRGYIRSIARTERVLARSGVYTLLDFHQDLYSISWRALDLDAARGWSRLAVGPDRGGARLSPRVARSRRTISLDAETVDALREHRGTQLLERDFALDGYNDQDFVFCDELGEPIRPDRLTDRFARLRKEAGAPPGTPHTLATPRRRWRSPPASLCTSSRRGSGTTPRPCSGHTPTCSPPRTRSQPSGWRRCST